MSGAKRWTGGISIVVSILVLVSCGQSGGSETGEGGPDQPVIVATTSIWADVTEAIACTEEGSVPVHALIERGADPHLASPTLADRDRVETADLIISNGLDLEHELEDILDGAGANHVVVAEVIEPQRIIGRNPHVWMDPDLVASAVDPIAEALVEAGLEAEAVEACVTDYRRALEELGAAHDELGSAMSSALDGSDDACQVVVTNHNSLDYLVRRLDLDLAGAVIASNSSMAEPSLAQLDRLAERVESGCGAALLVEAEADHGGADAFGERLGIEPVELVVESLGPVGSGTGTYLEAMAHNLDVLAVALGSAQR